MNVFLLFLVVSAIVDKNLFKLNASIFFMIHNAVIVCCLLTGPVINSTRKNLTWIIVGLISFTYVLQATITLITLEEMSRI